MNQMLREWLAALARVGVDAMRSAGRPGTASSDVNPLRYRSWDDMNEWERDGEVHRVKTILDAADGVELRSVSHPTPHDINPDALETVEIELPDPVTIRSADGGGDPKTDAMIISDQLGRIEVLMIRMLGELRKCA